MTLAGTLGVASGGTGLTTLTAGSLAYGAGTSAFSTLAIGTAGQILTVNSGGTAPQWTTLTSVSVTTFSAGTTGFTPSSATSGAVTLAGTLATTNGGTGLTSFTANGVVFASSSSVLATGSVLVFDGTNLGIGASPAQTLHVKTSTSGTPITLGVLSNATGLPALSFNGSYASTTMAGIYGNGATASSLYYEVPSGQSHFFGIADVTKVTIDSSGNVGIGTSSPTSGLQTNGSSSKSAFKTPNIAEVDTISATAATGTINYDVTTQSVLFYTSNASGNWTVNFRGSSGTSLNTLMQTGESISATFLVTQGSTAYYNSAVTIDGTSVTPKWQGGTAPTSGNASSIDSYTYVIQKRVWAKGLC